MKPGQVYILDGSDLSLYTGVTSNLENRLDQHHEGCFRGNTHSRRPVKLLWNSDLMDIQDANLLGEPSKNLGRPKKQAFIAENWITLQIPARRKNPEPGKTFALDGSCTMIGRSNGNDQVKVPHRSTDSRKLLL
jgi:putative endonuclease